jgi:hypothetical protein
VRTFNVNGYYIEAISEGIFLHHWNPGAGGFVWGGREGATRFAKVRARTIVLALGDRWGGGVWGAPDGPMAPRLRTTTAPSLTNHMIGRRIAL